ncbi:MAG: hypothetical protein ACYSSN_08165 [Planctomycetota bacterium]|jgi:hypothetical protein
MWMRRQEPGENRGFAIRLWRNPVWLMGASGFAFRIFMNSNFCPSAMSMFNFSAILPEAVEQAGYQCQYVSRMWDESALEKERRNEGHSAIAGGIEQGRPAVVWDVADCEWGLIVGYDANRKVYMTLTHTGQPSKLKFRKLGRNGIDILSVAIPGKPNKRSRQDVVRKSLEMAVNHAQQREWIDRPQYQDGLPGLDMWADIMDKGAMMAEAEKLKCCGHDALMFPEYFAGCFYGARCYARDYLKMIADSDEHLNQAAACYGQVAACLQPVWDCFVKRKWPKTEIFKKLAQHIRDAKDNEKKGIEFIKMHLDSDM